MNDTALSNALLPPLVRAMLSGLLFAWFVTALGRRLLGMLRVPTAAATTWEKAFVSGTIGAGALQYLPYGLASLGLLRPSYLRFGVTILGLLLCFDLFAVARASRDAVRRSSRRMSLATVVWGASFATLLVILLVRASTIGVLSDDDGYHLATPKRWLATGTLSYLPTFTNTNACMGFEMLYALGMAVWDAIAAKALNYAAGLFALFGVWLCAKRLSTGQAGLTAVSLLMIATPIVHLPFVFALAYVDLGTCWMVMGCLLFWLLWRTRLESRLLVGMGLCAGFAGSFKATALATGLAWAPAIALELRRRGASWQRCFVQVAGFGLVSLLPVLPWFYRNLRVTGNPLYPMLSSLVPTRDWNTEQASIFGKYVHYYTWAINSGSKLSEFRRKEILCAAVAAIAFAGGFVVRRIRRPELQGIALFAMAFTLISVFLTGLVFRYWLPAFMCAYLVACILVTEHRYARRWGFLLAPVLMGIALLRQLRENPSGHDLRRDLKLATGIRKLDEAYKGAPAWEAWRYLNAHTPTDARVLMASFYVAFGASSYGAFWVDRTCYATDSHLQAYIRFDNWTHFLQSVRNASIGYVVLPDQQSVQGRQVLPFSIARNEYPFCRRLVEQYGERVYQSGGFGVYRLELPLN